MNIDYEIEVEVDITPALDCDVAVNYIPEFGIEELPDEIEMEVTEPTDSNIELDTDGWETWGAGTVCQARGWVMQDGDVEEIKIYNFEIDPNGLIRGVGSDETNGIYDIIGALAGTDFLFNKTYRGGATVSYYGKVKDNIWAGKWNDESNSGEFNLCPKFQSWKGGFYQDGVRNEMLIDRLYIGRSGVKGSGLDVGGKFQVRGQWEGDIVSFAKTYTESQNTVFYAGNVSGLDITGSWIMQVGAGASGTFKMSSRLPLDM